MATFGWIPDQSPQGTETPRVNSGQFGDGYEQRVPEGINTLVDTWDLSFTLRTKTEILEIRDFLREHNGVLNFDWTTPAGETLKYICKSWRAVPQHDGDWSLSCRFERRYET